LEYANRKHEFMPGSWSITHKVKTNDARRTESLAHMLFEDYLDAESISTEMYFIPEGMTVKQMADCVREKDKVFVEHMEEEEQAKAAVASAQAALDALHRKHKAQIGLGLTPEQVVEAQL
jgi:cell division protein YceG involved in septum cleavage